MPKLVKGLYDEIITSTIRREIDALPASLKEVTIRIGEEEAIEYISRLIAIKVKKHLFELIESNDFEKSENRFQQAVKEILAFDGESSDIELSLLVAIQSRIVETLNSPEIPLSQSAFITNEAELNYHKVLLSEIRSADHIDFICPFIGMGGLNLIRNELAEFGSKLRVITTTYLGATNQRAIDWLSSTGAQVKVVYEQSDQKTALHAKAWIFKRDSGYSTATIGSSNLSPKALVDGLEWNVRLSIKDSPQVMQSLQVTFERLWESSKAKLYNSENDHDRRALSNALARERGKESKSQFFADIQPMPHQQEALDELKYARLNGKHENLIVAATGTGKTLLSAFDYQEMIKQQGGRPTLLFIAHREDILRQSIDAFRAVLRDSDFGELHVGKHRAGDWRHVFCSIQSLSQIELLDIEPRRFDFVIIDEFHHAEAPSYRRVLDYFKPRELVGLTATPERADGKNLIDRFGSPTYELRLWHALSRQLLAPFHYFGIDDGTDLSLIRWEAGKYSDQELNKLYVDSGNQRAQLIVRELIDKFDPLEELKAIAFCVSISHANFMAEQFRNAGFEASSLHSGVGRDLRDDTVSNFRRGELQILCTVDLFNEGIDIPEVNAVMFLRPTESATIYIQQLGRGLRSHRNKSALLVLDFVGQQNQKFRMDLRFRAMTGYSRRELADAIKDGFPQLPPGCHIRLDKTSEQRVLKNIREAIPSSSRAMIDELKRMSSIGESITLSNFLEETGLELEDVYNKRSFSDLKFLAGICPKPMSELKKTASLIHINDKIRTQNYLDCIRGNSSNINFRRMISSLTTGSIGELPNDPVMVNEIVELLEYIECKSINRTAVANDLPFRLYGLYSRDEIVAPFRDKPNSMRQGTFYVEKFKLDIHLFTLRKSERHFSPTTRYADYFMAPDLFHWESQSTTTIQSPTGRRLINDEGRHLVFVREDRDIDGRTAPFLCLGFAHPVRWQSEKPIQIVWRLEHSVPDHLYVRLQAAAG